MHWRTIVCRRLSDGGTYIFSSRFFCAQWKKLVHPKRNRTQPVWCSCEHMVSTWEAYNPCMHQIVHSYLPCMFSWQHLIHWLYKRTHKQKSGCPAVQVRCEETDSPTPNDPLSPRNTTWYVPLHRLFHGSVITLRGPRGLSYCKLLHINAGQWWWQGYLPRLLLISAFLYSRVLSIRRLGLGEVETSRKAGPRKDKRRRKAEHTCKNSIVASSPPLNVWTFDLWSLPGVLTWNIRAAPGMWTISASQLKGHFRKNIRARTP